MSTVLITDAGARNVVAAVRSLGRKGITIVCGDEKRIALSAFSKYCSRHLTYPSPKKQPDRWLEWLLSQIKTHDYDMIMPMDDDTVRLCSANKPEIARYTRIPVPGYDMLEKAFDKSRTLKIALENKIPCPETIFIEDIERVKEVAQKVKFPVVIKPRLSSGSRGIRYINNEEDLITTYAKVHSRYPYPLIQEYIPSGGRACGVFLLMNKKSEVRAIFAHKRLREFPVNGGPSTLRESIHFPELVERSIGLLKAMNWYGIAMLEYKQDPRDTVYKLMEINPRFWGSLELAISAGVDFPYLLYKMEMADDVEPVLDYPEGIRCRWLLPGDILHFICNPDRFRMKPSFFNFSKNNRRDDFISWRDPGPTLGFLLSAFRDIFSCEKWRHAIKR